MTGTIRTPEREKDIRTIIAQHAPTADILDIRVADLEDELVWNNVLAGADGVVHVASPFPATLPKHEDDLINPAKAGTLNILKAALSQGVKRVVKVSSSSAMIYGREAGKESKVYTEVDWTDLSNRKDTTPYFRSKTIAEQAAWQFAREHPDDIELVTVCPGAILGPVLETDIGTSANIVLKMLDGSAPALPPIGFEMVDVRDVAEILRLCLVNDEAAGERFAATAGYLSFSDVATILRTKYAQRRIPKYKLPKFAVRLFAHIDPTVKPILIELGHRREIDNSKSKSLLGWAPRTPDKAVADCAESLIQLGLV